MIHLGQWGQSEKANGSPSGNETKTSSCVVSPQPSSFPYLVTEPSPSPGRLPLLVALFPGKPFLDTAELVTEIAGIWFVLDLDPSRVALDAEMARKLCPVLGLN